MSLCNCNDPVYHTICKASCKCPFYLLFAHNLVVGPGALLDVCQCLKACSARLPYFPSRTVVKDSESAYADVGGGDNVAGTCMIE